MVHLGTSSPTHLRLQHVCYELLTKWKTGYSAKRLYLPINMPTAYVDEGHIKGHWLHMIPISTCT